MKPVELVAELIQHAQALHPNYTREQQFTWVSGILADIVLEKNHMDNIVLSRLNERIDRLYKTNTR